MNSSGRCARKLLSLSATKTSFIKLRLTHPITRMGWISLKASGTKFYFDHEHSPKNRWMIKEHNLIRCCKKHKAGNGMKSRKPTRRRVRHDIIIGILETAQHGELKTHIMDKVNLSFKQLEYYLNHLLSENFIRKEDNSYRTTEKGLAAIEACKICLKLTEK